MSKRKSAARMLEMTHLGGLIRAVGAWSGLLVLNYHRVGDHMPEALDHDLWSATQQALDAQVRFLKRELDVIGPEDLDGLPSARAGRYVLLTFDDGYRDNFELAFPVLQAHGVRAAFFIATGYLDWPRLPWWDEIAWMVRTSQRSGLPAGEWLPSSLALDEPNRQETVRALLARYKSLPGSQTEAYLEFLADVTGSGRCPDSLGSSLWMDWEMVRALDAAGMAVGGHTVTHPVLTSLSPERQREEIRGCASRIEQELGKEMVLFSYPVGTPESFDARTRTCLEEAGVRYSFSYYGGYNRPDCWDRYDLRRVSVARDVDLTLFRAMATFPQALARW